MNDAVREADKIVCEYMKQMGYTKNTTEKKSRRSFKSIALLLTFCIFAAYMVIKLIV
ncbi:MAG: hypothetical protein IKV89_04250 [Clostridia bacterium]|nr:hypothetical protein [Clostridia bacterium]